MIGGEIQIMLNEQTVQMIINSLRPFPTELGNEAIRKSIVDSASKDPILKMINMQIHK
jgi:hypothetical protein